jgi:hypothetical protein
MSPKSYYSITVDLKNNQKKAGTKIAITFDTDVILGFGFYFIWDILEYTSAKNWQTSEIFISFSSRYI